MFRRASARTTWPTRTATRSTSGSWRCAESWCGRDPSPGEQRLPLPQGAPASVRHPPGLGHSGAVGSRDRARRGARREVAPSATFRRVRRLTRPTGGWVLPPPPLGVVAGRARVLRPTRRRCPIRGAPWAPGAPSPWLQRSQRLPPGLRRSAGAAQSALVAASSLPVTSALWSLDGRQRQRHHSLVRSPRHGPRRLGSVQQSPRPPRLKRCQRCKRQSRTRCPVTQPRPRCQPLPQLLSKPLELAVELLQAL